MSGAKLLNSARLDGWKYYINSDGYAGIQESEGQHIMGGLWILKDEHWESLDSYEAVDLGFYTKAKIIVHDNLSRINKECIVYLSTNRNYGIPSKDYQDGVIKVQETWDYLKIIFAILNLGEPGSLLVIL